MNRTDDTVCQCFPVAPRDAETGLCCGTSSCMYYYSISFTFRGERERGVSDFFFLGVVCAAGLGCVIVVVVHHITQPTISYPMSII